MSCNKRLVISEPSILIDVFDSDLFSDQYQFTGAFNGVADRHDDLSVRCRRRFFSISKLILSPQNCFFWLCHVLLFPDRQRFFRDTYLFGISGLISGRFRGDLLGFRCRLGLLRSGDGFSRFCLR